MNWSLLLDTEAGKVFLILIFLIFFFRLIIKNFSYKKIESDKSNVNFFKTTPLNYLNNRFAQGEITREDFDNIKNKIRNVNSDIEKYKIVASLKSVVRTIPEKYS